MDRRCSRLCVIDEVLEVPISLHTIIVPLLSVVPEYVCAILEYGLTTSPVTTEKFLPR